MAQLTYHERYSDSPDEQRTFWSTAFAVLSSGGAVNPDFGETRYPKDAQKQDLVRIGQDFHRALSKFDFQKYFKMAERNRATSEEEFTEKETSRSESAEKYSSTFRIDRILEALILGNNTKRGTNFKSNERSLLWSASTAKDD